ncbi:MAG: tRNA (N(6)-L-threonylcarbamoyladenosine(37)-C(2))-methylthiotransferase MtaB, partial [Rhodospirillales bacterium]|nr:tRNA (N(6)-L-threonylcarbamoyladenosine(37)-C(2))-methylthiotransferase MtaB [Rhodospirillales bacterium]
MASPKVITLGCRLNAFEAEVMRCHAMAEGLDDTVIVNTCTVTAEAERQARQTVRKLRRENPDAKIIVTGCAAQMSAEKFASMPEVDRVIGNAEKLTEAAYRSNAPILVGDIMAVRETAGHLVEG